MKVKEILVTPDMVIPEVEEVNLQAHDRETGVKAVVDKTTMETICVVPLDNQIVQHNQVIAEVNKLENYITKKTMLLNKGRTLMIELTEREPKKIELLPADFLEVGARIYNDYGKSRGLSVQSYGTRVVCSNGMIAPIKSKPLEVYAYGTDEFNNEIETRINMGFSSWIDPEVRDLVSVANETVVNVKDIEPRLPRIPVKYMDLVLDELEDNDTIYNIWNAYLLVITHTIAEKSKVMNVIGLQKKANKILTLTKDFKKQEEM